MVFLVPECRGLWRYFGSQGSFFQLRVLIRGA